MAARMDMASGEVGQARGAGVKPAPGPKPRLTPKPFSLQRNTTLRSILAPKTLTRTPQPSQTTPTTPTTSSKPESNQPISGPVSDSSGAVKRDTESTMTPELANAPKAPSTITPHTDSTHTTEQNQAALSTSSSLTAPTSEPPASNISDPTGTSEANQVSESELDEHGDSDSGHSATGTEAVPLTSVTSAPLQPQSEDTVSEPTSAIIRCHAGEDQTARWGGCRKRLSMELTSRFESAGLSRPSQPPAKDNNQKQEQATKRETAVLKVSVLRTKEEEKITDSPETPSDPECRLKHSALLKEERVGEGVKEAGEENVCSIQRRISLLLDSSSRPEPLTKREEVPGPIKQADGSGGVKQRIKDWALDTPPVQASNQRVDVAPQPIPGRVHPALGVTGGSLVTSESVQLAPREDKASTLCHSGRSGIKVNSEEIEDEEEEGEEKGAQVPLYKPVGRLLRMEDGGKKQELVIDQIEKDMETKVKKEEKLKQLVLEERQAEKEREKERQQEVELEIERQKKVQKEKERERQNEEERKRERQREEEERKMKEEGRERQREIERERDRQRQREEEERERKRKEEDRERERQREEKRNRERQREEEERENTRKELEKEREREIELEREKEILRKEEERERSKEEERETERQIEVKREREGLRKEEERERSKEEERETERQIEVKREREGLRKEEEREMFRVEEERLREEDREKLIEEERERERKREEEKMKEDERQREKEQARERQREEEREKEQADSPVQLITLEPDQSPKPELPSRSTTIPIIESILKDEEQPHIKVVYNFSNKEEKPLLEVVNDNFSIKLGRWGSQARLVADRAQDETSFPGRLLGLQRTVVNTQESLNVKSHPAEGNIEWVVPTRENRMEKEHEKVDVEEEANVDTEEEQLKCCVGAGEGHDTEALIGGEPDKQYGGCDTRLSEDDSLQTTVEQISPVTPDEPNSTSPLEETEEPLAFPDISPPLLDTSAQRARAKLRKSRRTRPPRAVHQNSIRTLEENHVHDWRFCDSSDKVVSLTRGDCESDEEQPRGREVCSPPSQPQRIPLFSGMDPSALKAQLKKRTGGGVKGADTDSQTDSLAPSPSHLSRSPGCSSFLPGSSQMLPPVGNKDGGGDSSPSWLQELKSKKRLSQYNSED
ncbi:uncharacterized protein ACWYII_040038 [Salvelinus alpinus]